MEHKLKIWAWWIYSAIHIFVIIALVVAFSYFRDQGLARDAKTKSLVVANANLTRDNARLNQKLCESGNEAKLFINRVSSTTYQLVLFSVGPALKDPDNRETAKAFLRIAREGLTPPLMPTDCNPKE